MEGRDLLNNSTLVSMLPALARGANTYTAILDCAGEAPKVLAILDIGGVAAGGTCTVTFTECDTSDGTFTALDAFTAKSATGTFEKELTPTKRFIKVSAVVGVNAVTFAVIALAHNERFRPSNVAIVAA